MKLVDRVIDYVANRVLDRMEERRPVRNVTVNNVSGRGIEYASTIAADLERSVSSQLERQLQDRATLDTMRYKGRPSA